MIGKYKQCVRCSKYMDKVDDFYSWSKSFICKPCIRKGARETYRRHREDRLKKQRLKKECFRKNARNKYNEDPEYRKKVLARAKARYALKTGKIIKPSVCEVDGCNSTDIVIHHYDYDRPLDVMWVCFKCHHKIHRIDNNEMV